jgi:hypothetical protein
MFPYKLIILTVIISNSITYIFFRIFFEIWYNKEQKKKKIMKPVYCDAKHFDLSECVKYSYCYSCKLRKKYR